MSEFMASALPLNGTCTSSMPAIDLNISAARCGEVPVPEEA